jgi:predicted O-methyltransferase YrrM
MTTNSRRASTGPKRWAAAERFLEEVLVPFDPILEETLETSSSAGLPSHEVSPTMGRLLFLLARLARARRILEIGTLGAYSTIWLARALPPDGLVTTIEADPAHAAVARDNLERAGLARVVELRVGSALDSLSYLAADGTEPYDFVFIDADKPNNPRYLDLALDLTRPGSVIVADNVVRGGEVADALSPDPRVQGVRRFTEKLGADPRVEATAIQTVGAKGYDGFAVALVTDEA